MAPEEEQGAERLKNAIKQLKELKQKLESDACAVAMLWALGGIIDELCTDVCLSVHRRHRFDLLGLDMQNDAANRVVDLAGYDVHGQVPEKVPKSETFNCDHCGQKVGAAKFAAHLAKCMGHGGRNTRRGVELAPSNQGGFNPSPVMSTSPSNNGARPVVSPTPAGGAARPVMPGASPTKRPGDAPSHLGSAPPAEVKKPRTSTDAFVDLNGVGS